MSTKRKKLRRFGLWCLLAFGAITITLLIALNIWLNSSAVAGRIVQQIETETGLAARIGDVDFTPFPSPTLALQDLVVGEDDFRAEVETVSARVNWRSIYSGRIGIEILVVDKPAVYLPEEIVEIESKIQTLTDRLSGPAAQPTAAPAVDLNRIEIKAAAVYRGDRPALELGGTLWESYVANAARPYGRLEGSVPAFGDQCAFSLTFADPNLASHDHVVSLDIRNLDVQGLTETTLPVGPMAARIRASGSGYAIEDLIWEIEGEAEPGDHEMNLGGSFSGRAAVQNDLLVVNDFSWSGEGFNVLADATRYPDSRWSIQLSEANFDQQSLAVVASHLVFDPISIQAGRNASFNAEGLHFALDLSGTMQFESGNAALSGISVLGLEGRGVLTNVRANAAFDSEAVAFTVSAEEPFEFTGTVTPDFERQTLNATVAGEALISPGQVAALLDVSEIQDAGGRVVLERAALVASRANGLEELHYSGRLEEAALTVDAAPDFYETFTSISGSVSGDAAQVNATLTATAQAMGPISVQAALPYADSRIEATVTGNAVTLAEPVYWGPYAREKLGPAFAGFGEAQIEGDVFLPTAEQQRVRVEAEIVDAPGNRTLAGQFEWRAQGGGRGYALHGLEVTGRVPADGLRSFAPELDPAGMAAVRVTRSDDTPRFAVLVDLLETDLTYGKLAHKDAGLPASITIEGATGAPGWKPETFQLALLDQSFTGHYAGENLRFENVSIDLGKLNPLFQDGTNAGGSIVATIETEPTRVLAKSDGIQFSLAEGAQVEKLMGTAAFADDTWRFDNLNLVGANSELHVNGEFKGESWTGTVKGPRLDVQSILVFAETVNGEDGKDGADDGEEKADLSMDQFRANAAVAFDEVIYGPAGSNHPARFRNVKADMAWANEAMAIENLSAQSYGGVLTGRLAWSRAEKPSTLAIDVKLDTVGAELFDDVLFVEARNLKGQVSGPIAVQMPLSGEDAYLNGLSGATNLAAVDGTLGKMGMATQLLTILAGLQIWQIHRFPRGDQGLFYDDLAVRAVAEEGTVRIEKFALRNPYLDVGGSGTLDFPGQKSKIGIDVNVLEGILRPLNPIPVVGEATSRLGVVKLEANGPPTDTKMRVVNVAGFKGLTDRLKDAGGSARDVVEKEVVDRLIDAVGNLLGNRGG